MIGAGRHMVEAESPVIAERGGGDARGGVKQALEMEPGSAGS